MLRKNLVTALAVFAVLASASTANAAFRMRLERTSAPAQGVTVTDNSVSGSNGDTNAVTGFMNVSANLGAGVTIITGIGLQQPPIGGLVGLEVSGLDLNGTTIQSSGAAVVVLSLQATGYVGGANGLLAVTNSVGGTATGISSITFNSWVNASDAVPNYGAEQLTPAVLAAKGGVPAGSAGGVVTPLSFLGSSFSGMNSFSFTKAGAYSMFVEATITFGSQGGTVTFDNHLTVAAPEPMTIIAAMTGLPFIGGYILRRRKAAALSA